MAIKASLAIAALAIPLVLLGHPFFAVSLALGALAGALSETDDHPKGRVKSLILKTVSFAVSSLSVSLLQPYPILLGIGLSLSTVFFLLIGGLDERYRGVTFGTILVGIYAMIGASISPAWYWQPVLLTSGALFYGLFSLILLCLHPWRLLEEQLARGFAALSEYIELKAELFPSDESTQAKVRSQLALRNVKLVEALDRCRDVLNSYRDSLTSDEPLSPYLRHFMLLQSLHERAASSHERYDVLSHSPENRAVMEGIGQSLRQLSRAVKKLSYSLLTGIPYKHPVSLAWMMDVLNEQLAQGKVREESDLPLLISNISRSHHSLRNLSDELNRTIPPRLAKDERSLYRRFVDQLTWHNPRLRYAIRLSSCFLIGYTLSELLQLRKGEWVVLTCLFVLQSSYSATRRRLFQRVLGTLSGVIGGVLLIQILPTTMGQLAFMLVSAYFFFAWLKKYYAVSVIFITTFVLCAFNLVSHQGVALMWPRVVDTLIGSGLAFLSIRLLWPDWQYKRLPGLLREALLKNSAYLGAVLESYQKASSGDDLGYRIARRQAHRADNSLALAWQDMQMEPTNHRLFFEQAFQMTYENHALLSYISALGAHRMQHQLVSEAILPIARDVLKALDCAQAKLVASQVEQDMCVRSLLIRIREQMKTTENPLVKQQLTLLYNIADVTYHIMVLSQSMETVLIPAK